VAKTNDLGVVYGTCSISEPANSINLQTGVYMHVWRKDAQKGWQLLHESINLAPKK
jgi:ketosteroid isomerase-like protein